ncbi:P-loop containing nucleoside triphosphate hydrolase protein [Flammula alnicola]|nr:P-loop containing nucleoside triphosphate hydrolase protein [Flammula alnicola]
MSTPPKGTAHRRRANPVKKSHDPRPLSDKDLEGFRETLAKTWGFQPRNYQMDGIIAQLKRQDVLIHAGTGMGKTAVAAGPHAHPSAKGKVTIMVSPLIALHDEMVETFRDEFKLSATAVNSSNGGCSPDKLGKVVHGDWQIILISPEQLLSRTFITDVLKDPEFKQKLLSVVIDEAHVISHWGSGFRKKYGELGTIRSFLLKSTPIVALSATMPGRVRRDILRILRFDQKNFVNIDVGNDRPNVSIVIRGIHHPLNTYVDLDFVINLLAQTSLDISKTFIYCDNIAMGTEIIDHLTELLPIHLRTMGIIRPYNACFSKEYRKEVMHEFREGYVRILVCTDAAGMGCNLPDIDLVVQWKVPGSVSAFVQRAGRCARAAGHVGLAVLLAEQSVYSTILNENGNKPTKSKFKKGEKRKASAAVNQQRPNEDSKTRKNYSRARGGQRGSNDPALDAILIRDCPAIDKEAEDEGLYSWVQSGVCWRSVLTQIYGNKPPTPTVACCDICDPSLLDRTRPGKRSDITKTRRVKVGVPCLTVLEKLHDWRRLVKTRDFSASLFSADAVLSDAVVDLLASVGPVPTREKLSVILGGQWGWEMTYGDELFAAMKDMDIPPLVPLPTKSRATAAKRGHDGQERREKPAKKKKPVDLVREIPEDMQFTFEVSGYTPDFSTDLGPREGLFVVLS